jgi:alpha-tubulin suppressor-like RCC1 family protein
MEELSFTKITKIRAGQFSAALASDGSLFVWGEGVFGKFYNPKKI